FGAMVIDAKHFVPQSRPRLFIVGVKADLDIADKLIANKPSDQWHPEPLVAAHERLGFPKGYSLWWKLPMPTKRTKAFADIIEQAPTSVRWDTPFETQRLLGMM